MHKSLSKFVDRKRSQKIPLPELPPTRCYALTPSPSQEALVFTDASATADSDFFQLLPFELRRKILVEAFGNRTVHIDLVYDHPILPLEDRKITPSLHNRHAYFAPPWLRSQGELWAFKEWYWQGSVCHRESPSVAGTPMAHPLWKDECHRGVDSTWCSFRPGMSMDICCIGVMGWLLSCRQAYVEAIDVLYSTNTIHMASNAMILNLPRLLLPQRLASITSIEMLWNLHPFRESNVNDPLDSDPRAFHCLLQAMPLLFPGLRKLFISFHGDVLPPGKGSNARFEASESAILRPIDEMVGRLNARECHVAVPTSIYVPRKLKATGTGIYLEPSRLRNVWERIWRPLSNSDDQDDDSSSHRGYWLYHGKVDMPWIYKYGEKYPPDDEVL
ncbi:hypothetical protein LOZ12_001148 [Ophidiomyces ophidiicola]|uniref:Uncharacterized protein n=1 Tax=Ophidiomyces ophidiicola TaxID=1387563 RepID=A0ACB8V2D4_9EURO|nr:uncharacterized protein LOZ57_004862 [Ophidiomyces ophidiicola]KAI1916209.1 hypothetical protein LOZ61_001202 [Ophidiomyces ophidiicola]KAI1921051.1 hypothetical protein LOZ64_001677 [Ophidiomyces ophidiicola]KAI1929432.1 hypothetical protein LOZ60_001645 [Ophidiomyces ophidiicola]KAI1944503.1 hypothetical protein LOZ57_004862 [Ophidiomyces ophidiicola]KAI1954497.1 hypothetical protein LOZ62_000791 [Ophidiomyces ophidiicola]